MNLSAGVTRLFDEYRKAETDLHPSKTGEVITVDKVAARVASFYEKIRGVVDWREEHLLRKTAIERMLKRRIILNKTGKEIAEPLLEELVRGGHFPNNSIPIDKIDTVQSIIDKYVSVGLDDWVLSILAVEIEETLAYPRKERALIDFMTAEFQERMRPAGYEPHISVAVQRALFKLDDPTIIYHYWGHDTRSLLQKRTYIEEVLQSPVTEKIYRIAERHDTAYLISGDVIEQNLDTVFSEQEIQKAYDSRLFRLQGKIRRAAIYGIASIFITKLFIAFAVEIQIDRILGAELNYTAVILNILIPPLLMVFFVLTARTSTADNFQRVLMEVMKITQAAAEKEQYTIPTPRKKHRTLASVIYGVYLLSFIVSFGLIIWGLQKLHFSILSSLIFLMFISLVAFGGTKIRQRAGELIIGEDSREGFWDGIFDMFSLPIIQVGRWLSGKIARYNILVLALTFLIEIPFQVFVVFIDQWRKFLKEKKEEIH
jgi:hypothetical protein